MLPDPHAIPEPARRERGLKSAVAASVLLHTGLILAIARAAFTPPQREEIDARSTAVRITVVTRSPQRSRAPEVPVPEALPAADALDVPDEEDAPAAPALAEAIAESAEPAPAADTLQSTDTAADAQDPGTVDVARLQESVRGYSTAYRRELLDQSLQDCQEYRDRYARWDCPRGAEPETATQARIQARMETTFRAWDYGYDLNMARSEKLMTELLALRPLLEDPGPAGEAARAAHLVRVAEYERLNPHLRTRGNGTMVGTAFNGPSTGGSIMLLDIGLGGISVLNGLLSIRWDGKVSGPQRTPAPPPDDAE